MKLIFENASDELIEYTQSKLAEKLESASIVGVDFQFNTPEGRWTQMVLSRQGARLWSDSAPSSSPIYGGKLPKDAREVDLVIADLLYTKQQVDFFDKFGVTYIGRINLDPRNVLVLDHKKVPERHDVHLSDTLRAILRDSPADWWGTLGVVSAGNPDRLEAFMSALRDTIPLVLTTGAAAKMRYAGREFVYLTPPKPGDKPDIHYGLNMRGSANSLSRKLAMIETETGEPQGDDPGWSGKEVSVQITQ